MTVVDVRHALEQYAPGSPVCTVQGGTTQYYTEVVGVRRVGKMVVLDVEPSQERDTQP